VLLAPARRQFLYGCLRALDDALDGRLLVVAGMPEEVIPRVAVERALAARGTRLVRTGSPYAVAPSRVRTADGGRFRVFTPFHRAWVAHGWRAPATTDAATVRWLDPRDIGLVADVITASFLAKISTYRGNGVPDTSCGFWWTAISRLGLAHIPGKHVHQPWKRHLTDEAEYPRPIVSHDQERPGRTRPLRPGQKTPVPSRSDHTLPPKPFTLQ
jgi:deoxyribodipyrimidine photolyase